VGDRKRREAGDPAGGLAQRQPADAGAPVVRDQMKPCPTEGVGYGEDIGDQVLVAIGVDTGRAGAGAIAALVGRDAGMTRRRQRRHQRLPHHRGFGKAVKQENRRAVRWTRAPDGKIEASRIQVECRERLVHVGAPA
jgi:hypothetical protein